MVTRQFEKWDKGDLDTKNLLQSLWNYNRRRWKKRQRAMEGTTPTPEPEPSDRRLAFGGIILTLSGETLELGE